MKISEAIKGTVVDRPYGVLTKQPVCNKHMLLHIRISTSVLSGQELTGNSCCHGDVMPYLRHSGLNRQ